MKLLIENFWSNVVPLKPVTAVAQFATPVAGQLWLGMPRKRTLGITPCGSAPGNRSGVFTPRVDRLTSESSTGPMKTPPRPRPYVNSFTRVGLKEWVRVAEKTSPGPFLRTTEDEVRGK